MDLSIQTANRQAADTLDKYKAGLDEIFENHKSASYSAAKETINHKKTMIKRNVKKNCSDKEAELKKQITLKNNLYKQQIFEEAETLLEDFKKSSEYFDYLCRLIKHAVTFADKEEIKIYIDPEDSNLKDRLESTTHSCILLNEFSFNGGIRAVIPSRNILIDETFESRLSELKENYRINY